MTSEADKELLLRVAPPPSRPCRQRRPGRGGEDVKADHERIWLQNADDAAAIGASREWCSAPVWPDDPEDSEPTEYVRADLVATARAEARKAALEEAAALADQWSEARLDEANAPIISGDVFTDGGVFVQSTADANAGYRLMDLATAIRALIGADPATDREEG